MKFLALLLSLFAAVPALANPGERQPVGWSKGSDGRFQYLDFNEKEMPEPSAATAAKVPFQAVSITQEVVVDFQCLPNPGNPSPGNVRLYCDSGTGNLTCLTSTGASCLGGGGGGGGGASSVGLAGPTGIPITNSPVTTSGTLTWAMPTGWILGDLLVGNGANSVARLAAPTTPNSVPQVFMSTPSAGIGQIGAYALLGIAGRTVSGTSDTILATDRANSVEYTSNSAVAITVPDPASSSGFNQSPAFITINEGQGIDTFTPQTSAVITYCNGAVCFANQPTLPLLPGQYATWSSPSTANWLVRISTTGSGTATPLFNDQLLSGGGVVWTGGLNFTISAACYQIAATTYCSPQTNVTLAAADPTNPRIDAFIVDSTGTASVLTGTPAGSPSSPSVDPTSQLLLTIATVAANAVVPTLNNILVYDENLTPPTEWTCTPSANFNCNSTNNPFHGSKDIEVTTAVATNNVALVNSGTVNLSTYASFSFNIRNKANWPNQKSLSICFKNGSTIVGTCVAFKNGVFGFNQANTTSYQQIVIPLSAFGLGATVVDRVTFTVVGGQASIGFYLDFIQIQSAIGVGGGPNLQLQVNGSNTQSTANLKDSGTVTFTKSDVGGVSTITAAATGSSGLSGMTAGQVPIAATASTVTSSTPLQGTDSSILTSGTISASTGVSLCTDANHGATTTGCASGGVTSVGLSMPAAEFSVANSPVTTTGTLTVTKANQNPNLVWAGPTSSASSNLVQSAQTTNNSTSPITLAYPSNNAANNLLIIVTDSYNGNPTAFSDTAGDTFQHPISFSTSGIYYDVFYTCASIGGANTVSATRAGNSQFMMHIYEFSGNATVSCLDASLTTYHNATVPALASLTTSGSVAQATELVFASLNINSIAAASISAGANFTSTGLQGSFNSGNVQEYLLEEIGTATTGLSGAQTATFIPAVSGSGNYNGAILTFKLNTSGSAIPTFRSLINSDLPLHTRNPQFEKVSAAQTSAISDTPMFSPTADGFFNFTGEVNCTQSTSTATATLNLKWTDTSNTAQTLSVVATCTTLGASSVADIVHSIRAKSGTNITYGVTVANSPHFDVQVLLEQVN